MNHEKQRRSDEKKTVNENKTESIDGTDIFKCKCKKPKIMKQNRIIKFERKKLLKKYCITSIVYKKFCKTKR